MAARFDTITFLSDYGTGDEFVGVVKSVIRADRAARHGRRPHPRDARLRRAGRRPHARPGRAVPRARAWCWRWSTPASAPSAAPSRWRSAAGRATSSVPTTACWRGAVAMCGGATAAVELTNPEYQLAAPGPTFAGRDVFAPGRRPPVRRRAARRPRPPDRPAVAAARAAAAHPRGGRHARRRGAVGRPLRQLPAQRRPRRGRRLRAAGAAPLGRRRAHRRAVAHLRGHRRRARSASSSTATGCCRSASASARPPPSCAWPSAPRSSSPHRPTTAHRRCARHAHHEGDRMRPGTTLVLAILLALILGAAALQLFFML